MIPIEAMIMIKMKVKRSFRTDFAILGCIRIGDNFCFRRGSPNISFHNSAMYLFPLFSYRFFPHRVFISHYFIQF